MKFIKFPKHIAIIMDGNGRWGLKRKRSRIYGHRQGLRAVVNIINISIKLKLEVLTLYAFSIENWNRPSLEVNYLMRMFYNVLKNKFLYLHKKNICVKIIGERKGLSLKLCKAIYKIERKTQNNLGLKLNIAINYSGKWDIVCCIKSILHDLDNKLFHIKDINQDIIEKKMCLNYLPSIDLVIRTGGEKRISNFLLWQIAYSELYFINILWPDFNSLHFLLALKFYSKRIRKFGKIVNES